MELKSKCGGVAELKSIFFGGVANLILTFLEMCGIIKIQNQKGENMNTKTDVKLHNGDARPTSPLSAIKAFCLECCGYSRDDVKGCTAPMCPLWEFRDGHNPYRKGREYTDEEKVELAERMKRARESLKPKYEM